MGIQHACNRYPPHSLLDDASCSQENQGDLLVCVFVCMYMCVWGYPFLSLPRNQLRFSYEHVLSIKFNPWLNYFDWNTFIILRLSRPLVVHSSRSETCCMLNRFQKLLLVLNSVKAPPAIFQRCLESTSFLQAAIFASLNIVALALNLAMQNCRMTNFRNPIDLKKEDHKNERLQNITRCLEPPSHGCLRLFSKEVATFGPCKNLQICSCVLMNWFEGRRANIQTDCEHHSQYKCQSILPMVIFQNHTHVFWTFLETDMNCRP